MVRINRSRFYVLSSGQSFPGFTEFILHKVNMLIFIKKEKEYLNYLVFFFCKTKYNSTRFAEALLSISFSFGIPLTNGNQVSKQSKGPRNTGWQFSKPGITRIDVITFTVFCYE